MKFQSALELQAKIFQDVFDFKEVPVIASVFGAEASSYVDPVLFDAEPRKSRKSVKQRRAVRDIALGIMQDGEAEYAEVKLAVLVQSREEMKSSALNRIVDLAKNEAEVMYIGRQKPLAWPQTRLDPVRLGSSISPVTAGYAGTLGCFCSDATSGVKGILSNNHVLADVNRVPIGTRIMQPGGADGGRPGMDDIVELLRYVPIQFAGVPNLVDCAVARLIPGLTRKLDLVGIYDCKSPPVRQLAFAPPSPGTASLGMTVFKTGRTTCFTRGKVMTVNVNNYVVNMGVGYARFDGQILIQMDMNPGAPFSLAGDSGSIIVDSMAQPIGLLFAGSSSGGAGGFGITAANPISTVLAQLGVSLI